MVKSGSRDVLLLLTSMVLASVPVGYLQVVLPLYLNRAGLEPSVIGLLYSLSGLVTAGAFLLSGRRPAPVGRCVGLGLVAAPSALWHSFSSALHPPRARVAAPAVSVRGGAP